MSALDTVKSIPLLGSAVSLFEGIGRSIERGVNSSEHNFKKDLQQELVKAGMPPLSKEDVDKLNSGKDEELTEKMQTLIDEGKVPMELVQVLASQNKVPQSSINPSALRYPGYG